LYGATLATLILLGGCIQVGGGAKDEPAPSLYTLRAPEAPSMAIARPQRGAAAIVVPKPELPPQLRTERIALHLDDGRRLDYYADAKWSAPLADLMQEFIIDTARAELPGRIVDTPEGGAAARYRLMVKIEEFEPSYAGAADAPPRLDAAMTMTLVALPDGGVKSRVTAKRSAQASANTLGTVTREMEALLHTVTQEALRKLEPALAAR
jgi:ABC-type uncharacterized transport system auxiliary subunit